MWNARDMKLTVVTGGVERVIHVESWEMNVENREFPATQTLTINGIQGERFEVTMESDKSKRFMNNAFGKKKQKKTNVGRTF